MECQQQVLLDLKKLLLVGQIAWCLEGLKHHKMKYQMVQDALTHLDYYTLAVEVASYDLVVLILRLKVVLSYLACY